MVNPLHLNAAEIDAIRELQAGMPQPDPGDPIWDELEAVGLVEVRGAAPELTELGQRYNLD
jgi:hypothetical protein